MSDTGSEQATVEEQPAEEAPKEEEPKEEEPKEEAPKEEAPKEEACPYSALTSLYFKDDRFNPDKVYDRFKDYEYISDQVQAMLFFRRIVPYAALVALVNVFFILVAVFHMSAVPVFFLLVAIYNVVKLVIAVAGAKIGQILFAELKPEERGKETDSNKIYPLRNITDRLSFICFRITHCCEEHICKKEGVVGFGIKAGVAFGLFILFSITGVLVPAWIIADLILILPGVLFLPQVFPHVKPFFMGFAKHIGCPHCKQA